MNDFTFRIAEAGDFDEVKKLCDERYGTGYMTKDTFEHFYECRTLFMSAFYKDEFAGFAAMMPSGDEEIAQKMGMSAEEVKKITLGQPALIYKSHAIKKKFEKMGLPIAMTSRLMSAGKKQGYGWIFGSAWMYDEYIPMEKTFNKLGFRKLYRRHNLWYNDENYCCVICGGRCRCDAMIYVKELSEQESGIGECING